MQLKEEDVHSREYGSSLDELDKLMIKQLEMEEALQNKELKVNDIKRITLIESEFRALKEKEEEARWEGFNVCTAMINACHTYDSQWNSMVFNDHLS